MSTFPFTDMPSPVIYPVDFKKAGHIVDDVSYVYLLLSH